MACWIGAVLMNSSGAHAEATVQAASSNTDLIADAKPFPGEFWRFYSGKKDAVIGDTWNIQTDPETNKPILVCKGEPPGYLLTKQFYEDFELELEWRYPVDANGNSGILLFINGEDHLWPTSIQVQLYQPEAGQTFPHAAAQTDNTIQKVPMLSKPVNHWNRCHIVSQSGTLTVTVNGQKVGEVTGCRPKSGAIGLQSEGALVHFRNFTIRAVTKQTVIPAKGGKDDLPSEKAQPVSGVLTTEPLKFVVPPQDPPATLKEIGK